MEYAIYKEFDCADFDFWSGAEDDGKAIRNSSIEIQCLINNYVETMFGDNENPPTDTDINDLFWHDGESVYKDLGLKWFKDEKDNFCLELLDNLVPSEFDWQDDKEHQDLYKTFEEYGGNWCDVDEKFREEVDKDFYSEKTIKEFTEKCYRTYLNRQIGYVAYQIRNHKFTEDTELINLFNWYDSEIADWDDIQDMFDEDFLYDSDTTITEEWLKETLQIQYDDCYNEED